MRCRDVEWAAFLYNAIGEDKSYIMHLHRVKCGMKDAQTIDDKVAEEIVTFLNEWRSRAYRKGVKPTIREWYSEVKDKLDTLHQSLIEADFEDGSISESIREIYGKLVEKAYVGDTIASKILHILKPDLFVAWDIAIKEWYRSVLSDGGKGVDSDELYLRFLRKMQEEASSLIEENGNFLDELNSKVIRLWRGDQEQTKKVGTEPSDPDEGKEEKISSYGEISELMERNGGKTMAKYLDEYNWITITNKVKIPPEWHPDWED